MQKSHVKGLIDNSGGWYKSIADILKYQASLVPEREAFIIYHSRTERESITFSAVYEKCKKFAASLISLGIKNREKVVFYEQNSIETVIAQFGVLMIGAIPVNTYVTAHGTSEMRNILKKIKPVALILETNFPGATADLNDLKRECASLNHIIATDLPENDGVCLSFRSLLDNVPPCDAASYIVPNPEDIAIICGTSGSTAKPKYMFLSYKPLLYRSSSETGPISGQVIKTFSNSYFSYFAGHPLKTLKNGITRVSMHGVMTEQQLQDTLSIVKKENCNFLSLSFSSARKIVFQNMQIPKSVKVISLGGSPLTRDMGKLLDQVTVLNCGYGTLETGPISMLLVRQKSEMENNIGGYPVDNVEIKIVDQNNIIVDRGVTGKIFVRTPFPCTSFMRDDDEEEHMLGDGWADTKDTGYISDDGKVYVLGRENKVMIDADSHNIPELENTFKAFDIEGIEDLVVIPVPDPEHYQSICVCIIKTPGSSLTKSKFLDICRAKGLWYFLKPKYVLFMDSFPMTANEKISRYVLKEQVVKDLIANVPNVD